MALQVNDLSLSFNGVTALWQVSFEVREGEILAVIGPNGAGKSCVLNCINGFYRPQVGQVIFKGKDITHLSPHKIAELGIARTFQKIELYKGLSTLDNLMAARHIHMKRGAFWNFWYFGPTRKEEIAHREAVENIIDLLELESIRKTPVGQLPYGQRKRVELGRALACEPELLLLDEPMTGMNVEEKEDMARFILDIVELKKTPMVLVEHDMEVVTDLSDRVVVLNFGRKLVEGLPEEVKKNPEVIQAYLGAEEGEGL